MSFNKKLWEKAKEFENYMKSDEWKNLKNQRLKKDGFCCVLCKSKEHLICHHLTYKRLFNEEINDLITLCKRCHNKIHKISPPIDRPPFTFQNINSKIFEPESEEEKRKLIKQAYNNFEGVK